MMPPTTHKCRPEFLAPTAIFRRCSAVFTSKRTSSFQNLTAGWSRDRQRSPMFGRITVRCNCPTVWPRRVEGRAASAGHPFPPPRSRPPRLLQPGSSYTWSVGLPGGRQSSECPDCGRGRGLLVVHPPTTPELLTLLRAIRAARRSRSAGSSNPSEDSWSARGPPAPYGRLPLPSRTAPLTRRWPALGSRPSIVFQLRIEHVPQAIAEQIDAQHRQHDRQAGHRADPPGVAQVVAALGQHSSPGRGRRLDPEAEET